MFQVGSAWKNDYIHFVEQVLEKGMHPTVWGQGRVLSARPATDCFLRDGLTSIRRLLGDGAGGRWFRRRPLVYSEESGAITVLRPELDYRYEPPQDVESCPWSFVEYLEPAVPMDISARRWMAQRMAMTLTRWQKPGDSSAASWMPALLAKLAAKSPAQAVQLEELCADAWIAAKALTREWEELSPDPDGVPGFRGPDEWYSCAGAG
jgi:hypothetical protein